MTVGLVENELADCLVTAFDAVMISFGLPAEGNAISAGLITAIILVSQKW
jgi:hypothetical protein